MSELIQRCVLLCSLKSRETAMQVNSIDMLRLISLNTARLELRNTIISSLISRRCRYVRALQILRVASSVWCDGCSRQIMPSFMPLE